MKWSFKKTWIVVVAVLFLVLICEILTLSKTDTVIGEVHHQRQRQAIVGGRFFGGSAGRLTANRYLIASEKIAVKVLETVDLNIIFFAGHPNERGGVDEQERVSWIFIPFFVLGIISVVTSKKVWWKNMIFLWLAIGVVWAIRFEKINEMALQGVIFWVWGMIGIGGYGLVRKIWK